MVDLFWLLVGLLLYAQRIRERRLELVAFQADASEMQWIRNRIQDERWGVWAPHDFGGRRKRDRVFEPCPGDWLT